MIVLIVFLEELICKMKDFKKLGYMGRGVEYRVSLRCLNVVCFIVFFVNVIFFFMNWYIGVVEVVKFYINC